MMMAKFKMNGHNVTLFYSEDHMIDPIVECLTCAEIDSTIKEAFYFMALHNVQTMIVDGLKITRPY